MELLEEFEIVQSLEFELEEYENRASRLRESLSGSADTVLLFAPDALRYFSGYRSLLSKSRWRPLALCLPASAEGEPFLVVPEQDHGAARVTSPYSLAVAAESVRHGYVDPIEALCEELGRRGLGRGRIGMELGFGQRLGMSVREFERFRSLLPDAEIVDATDALWATRAVKSPLEIEYLRTACQISCDGVRAGFEALRPGISEREAHRVMFESMVAAGAEEVWLTFGSGAKGYGAFNSYPSDELLQPGHFIWVDGGARYRGYVCDYIRSAVIGEPSEDQSRWYTAALESNRAAAALVKPGARSCDIFAAARGYIEDAGLLDAWGLNVLGHGVGVEIHELPSLTEDSVEPLVVGNVVTIEPSLSPPRHEHGHYIVEDVIAVTADGQDNLTASMPAELWVAGV